MSNNVTITQNDSNIQNISQMPYFQQPKNPTMEVKISPYGNPILEVENGNEIVKNSNDFELKRQAFLNSQYNKKKIRYKLSPKKIICPYCYEFIKTNVKWNFNYCTLILSIVFNIYYFLIILSCGYEFLCYDGIHTCSNCGRILGTYESPGKSCCKSG